MSDVSRTILVVTFGSYGDLHPFLAVALALKARGQTVVFATLADYKAKVEALGLTFVAAGPTFADLEASTGLPVAEILHRMGRSHAYMMRELVAPHVEAAFETLLPHVRAADAVFGSAFVFGAHLAARVSGTPFLAGVLQPSALLSAWDPPVSPGAPFWQQPHGPLARQWNRLMFACGEAVLAPALRTITRLYRQQGLKDKLGIGFAGSDRLHLGLWSPVLCDSPPDAPPGTEVVGYTFFDSDDGHPAPPDPDLEAWLEAGPPPILFTLGSVVVHAGTEFYRSALRLSERLNTRALLLVGRDSPLLKEPPRDAVRIRAYAPHSQVFPKARLIVHHGGIGTTGQALRAGKPQMIVPALGDQYDNAARLERLGIARSLHLRRWTDGRALPHLKALLNDPAIAPRAEALAAQVRAETGAETAAERIISALR
ncbi:MAG: glycosyltransferase [Asticcacaulis sp.]